MQTNQLACVIPVANTTQLEVCWQEQFICTPAFYNCIWHTLCPHQWFEDHYQSIWIHPSIELRVHHFRLQWRTCDSSESIHSSFSSSARFVTFSKFGVLSRFRNILRKSFLRKSQIGKPLWAISSPSILVQWGMWNLRWSPLEEYQVTKLDPTC